MRTAADAGTHSRPFTVETEIDRLFGGEHQAPAYRASPGQRPDFIYDPHTDTLHRVSSAPGIPAGRALT